MKPKLHECTADSKTTIYREVLGYALVTPTDTVATNANILVVHKTEELFGKSFADSLPKGGILLSKEALKSIAKTTFFDMEYDKDKQQVSITHMVKESALTSLFPVLLNEENGMTFPKYASLFDVKNEWGDNEVEIGLNPKLFNQLANGLGWTGKVAISLGSPTNAIVVRNTKDSLFPSGKGLIMPCMLT